MAAPTFHSERKTIIPKNSILLPPLENPATRNKPVWPILQKPDWIDVRPSPVHGYGAFAKRVIRPQEVIVELDGQILTIGELARITQNTRSGIHETLLNYFFMEWNFIPDFDNHNRIMARPLRTVYSYINHSRTPNCKIIGQYPRKMWVETIKEIRQGEELFLDYREESIPRWYQNGHGATYL